METISNFATSTLSGTITAGATSLTVANGAVFPATGTFRIRIDNEILTVATRAGNVLSGLGRGIEGTSAVGHTTGVTVRHVLTAAAVHQLRQDHVWVSVKDPAFGAVGDGVTDDGPACRAALAAVASGGTVYFPPGTYLFASLDASTDCLNISQNDHIAIVGSGIGATTLKVGVASWRSIIRGDQSTTLPFAT